MRYHTNRPVFNGNDSLTLHVRIRARLVRRGVLSV